MQKIKPKKPKSQKLVRFQKRGRMVRIVLSEKLVHPFIYGDIVSVYVNKKNMFIKEGEDYKVCEAQYHGTDHLYIDVPLPVKPENTDDARVQDDKIIIRMY